MALTTEEIHALLTDATRTYGYGADLLDADDGFVEDLSAYFAGGSLTHNNRAEVHGSGQLRLLCERDWSVDRVRPYVTVTAGGITDRFDQGIWLLTRPRVRLGCTPAVYEVDVLDKVSLLACEIGDAYVVESGTVVVDAIQQAITDAGYTGSTPYLEGTGGSTTLAADRVWVLDRTDPIRYLDVVNALLGEIGYNPIHADNAGTLTSEPETDPATQSPVWAFDLSDLDHDIVMSRELATETSTDSRARYNWWRFLRIGAESPAEGNGQYTVDHSEGGHEYRASPMEIEAADQTTLESRGDQIVRDDEQTLRTIPITTKPLPILGHLDTVTYSDPQVGIVTCQVREYTQVFGRANTRATLEVLE